MRPQELMIGDLIMASVYEEEIDDDVYHPARIMALSSISELFDGNYSIDWLDDCASESCGDIEPIPLTEEILKANGFEELGDSFGYRKYNNIHLFDINFSFLFRKTYNCVHQLQHALRMYGWNEMADNFKIE